MTRSDIMTEPVDERWVAHMRDLSTGIVPPTPADPHDMSRVAIRRTRARRAVLVTGGGVTAVAAVAVTAFALGGPTTQGVLLPGAPASVSVSADPSSEAAVSAAEAEALAREKERLAAVALAPDGWHVHELEGLTYALPPEIVSSGPVQDEPGVTSDMWHSSEDPDAPPFIRVAYYAEGSESPAWPDVASKADAREFKLPGASRALVADISAEVAGLPSGTEVPGDWKGPRMFVIESADGPGTYVITLNLPREGSAEFVQEFQASLTLD
jgi:hypothetical protein